jgi:hypothetical protein
LRADPPPATVGSGHSPSSRTITNDIDDYTFDVAGGKQVLRYFPRRSTRWSQYFSMPLEDEAAALELLPLKP